MKKTTKKIFLGLGLSLLGTIANAQDGLEKIIVEKYYVSTAADSIGSIGILPVGSVTYRVYADMLPGYKFQALYGNSDHPLKISTSTSFFNNEDRGAATANAIASPQLKNNTVALDSWFSVGASAGGQFGVLKSEDDGKANLLTLNKLLKNNTAAMGIALTAQDGNLAGSPEAVTFVGYDPIGGLFDATSQAGNSLIITDGAISALGGATGPTIENRILLGQFTTDGIFSFEFNIQIGTPTPGVSQKYVVSNPINGEKTIASLNYESNIAPIVTITSPANNTTFLTGAIANITASASDKDGSISQVEFFVDGKSIGVDNSAPYTYAYTSVTGTHLITAIAKDNKGDSTVSEAITIVVKDNQAPTVLVAIPATAMTGDMVAITATANDVDGTIASVEFFVDNVSVGKDTTLPFSTTWIAQVGTYKIKAVATDNNGLTANSSEETIQVTDNQAPTVNINVVPTAMNGDTVALIADVKDVDGTIASVEFFVDDVSVGTISTAPFTLKWNATVGTHKVKVVATDNKGLTGTSSDSTIIVKEKENSAPVVSVNIPSTANTGDVVTLTATANDSDGTVASVEFFVDNVSVGKDTTIPFSTTWIAQVGTFKIKAVATDNKGLTTNSTEETIQVTDNQAPTVSIAVAPTAMTGDMIAINANAKDVDGTIDSVQFFVDETYLGTDTSAPYSINWNAISGTHKIKAIAIDNKGLKGTSKDSTIIVKDNVAPIVTVSTPANAITGDSIIITATATDSDGTIASVEFFVDDVSIGTDATSPYAISYKTTFGKHFIKAVATDNFGLKGTSKIDSITVVNNQAPVVTIQTPKNAITGDEVTFTSTAIDKDGTITQVEFFVDNISVGIDTIAPYANKWVAKVGVHKIKAIATDNRGFTGTSADSVLEVVDNKAPLVELIVDSTAIVGANVLITVNATDTDGSIKKVEFFIDNVVLASDSIAPYTSTWKAVAGKHTVKILATDNRGLTSTKTKDIMVKDNNVSIETIAANLQTLVYPNPANQELSIIASENASVEITDISGKVIAYKNELIANTTHHVAVSEFSAGVYLVRIFNANYTKTERVVINN